MARILSDESTLTRQDRALARESGILRTLGRIELVLAGVLLAAGVVLYVLRGSMAFLVLGIVAVFLGIGHLLKTRENEKQKRHIKAGIDGEVKVSEILQRELDNGSYILNDITVRRGWHSAQIDHVVVNPGGIFILETKNWRGRLTGDENEATWEQRKEGSGRPVKVHNPILQNARHVAVFRAYLEGRGVDWPEVHSAIVMMNRSSSWDIRHQTVPILKLTDIADYIAGFPCSTPHTGEQVNAVLNLFVKP